MYFKSGQANQGKSSLQIRRLAKEKLMKLPFLFRTATAALLLSAFLSCGDSPSSSENEDSSSSEISSSSSSQSPNSSGNVIGVHPLSFNYPEQISIHSFLSEPDTSGATYITLNESDIQTAGSGAIVLNNTVTFYQSGTFVISGTLDDGQLIVEAGDEDQVTLIFANAQIHCSNHAPVWVKNAAHTQIHLQAASTNSLSDGGEYFLLEGDSEPNAALFSTDDLTISGSGILNITSQNKDGIASKDGLILSNATVNVTAPDDGIRGKDYLKLENTTIHIEAGSLGLVSTHNDNEEKGFIMVDGGELTINAGEDGISAVTLVDLISGDISIQAGDDGIFSDSIVRQQNSNLVIEDAVEGIESHCMEILGGTIQISSQDDGLNLSGPRQDTIPGPAGPLLIEDGLIYVNASGDGIDVNGSIVMSGGTVLIDGPESSEFGAIDYDGEFLISGGLLAATGASAFAMKPSDHSEQYSFLKTFAALDAQTPLYVSDENNNCLMGWIPSKEFESAVFSSPELEASAILHTQGTIDGEETFGFYEQPDCSGGLVLGK
jgi:hypothetical protein